MIRRHFLVIAAVVVGLGWPVPNFTWYFGNHPQWVFGYDGDLRFGHTDDCLFVDYYLVLLARALVAGVPVWLILRWWSRDAAGHPRSSP